jgi:hypothetical protein
VQPVTQQLAPLVTGDSVVGIQVQKVIGTSQYVHRS